MSDIRYSSHEIRLSNNEHRILAFLPVVKSHNMSRRWLLAFGVLVLAAVAILASSLHDVHFQQGRALPVQSSPAAPQASSLISNAPATSLWKSLVICAAFVINLIIFYFLIPPEQRKKILRMVTRLALTVLALLIALHYRLIQIPTLDGPPPTNNGAPAPGLGSDADVPTFHQPEMTPWLIYLISLAVIATLLLLTWAGYRGWMRTHARSLSGLDDIAEIAQSSLNDIASGRDWGDVIVQSYVRMGEVVSARRGLNRAEAMTPREFATRLEYAGLPAEAVKGLTRLFESARYGARKSSQSDVNEAVACLNSILQACGVTP